MSSWTEGLGGGYHNSHKNGEPPVPADSRVWLCRARLSRLQSAFYWSDSNILYVNLPDGLDDFQIGGGDDSKGEDEAQEVDEDDVGDGDSGLRALLSWPDHSAAINSLRESLLNINHLSINQDVTQILEKYVWKIVEEFGESIYYNVILFLFHQGIYLKT